MLLKKWLLLLVIHSEWYSVIMMCNCDRVFHLKRDGGAPGDVSESHSKEEANVYLVSETA